MKFIKKWDYENTYNEAKKYKSRSEFKKGKLWAYKSACANKWLDDYDWFSKPIKPYTVDQCIEIAKKCKSKSEYQNKCQACYKKAKETGLLNTFTWFKHPVVTKQDANAKIYWIYGYFDNDNKSVYIGLTKRKYRDKQHRSFAHNKGYDSVMSYFININKELPPQTIIEKDLTSSEAQKKEEYYIDYYRQNGWNIINKAKAGSLGSAGYKWDKETILKESKKYATLKEFLYKSPTCYAAAKKFNLLKMMTWLKCERHYWTYEECYSEAIKYKFAIDLEKANKAAFYAAIRNGWYKDYTWLKHKHNCPIQQVDVEGNIINEFKNVKEASSKLGIKESCIYASCLKHRLIKNRSFYFKRKEI